MIASVEPATEANAGISRTPTLQPTSRAQRCLKRPTTCEGEDKGNLADYDEDAAQAKREVAAADLSVDETARPLMTTRTWANGGSKKGAGPSTAIRNALQGKRDKQASQGPIKEPTMNNAPPTQAMLQPPSCTTDQTRRKEDIDHEDPAKSECGRLKLRRKYSSEGAEDLAL